MDQVTDTRALRARQKAERKKSKAEAEQKVKEAEAAIHAALTKPALKPHELAGHLFASVHYKDQDGFRDFFVAIIEVYPRFLTSDWRGPLTALYTAAVLTGANLSLKDWKPKAKGTRSVFQHLARHLLEKYHQPPILWTALDEDPNISLTLAPVVAEVAQGGSLFKTIPGLFPVALSRKQCHELLQSSASMGFLLAVRFQQAKAHGGDLRLAKAWKASNRGASLGSVNEEAFWETVLAFFAKNPMLDLNQIGPVIDYVNYRRNQDFNFSMKGRTPMALLKDMEEWHQTLHRVKVAGANSFMPSGFSPYQVDRSSRDASGNFTQEVWTVSEILSGKELADEGRKQSHCVASYSWSIERKTVSIWSMRVVRDLGEERALTIEVQNKDRRVVQARGYSNRRSTPAEFRVLNAWAQQNHLSLANYL